MQKNEKNTLYRKKIYQYGKTLIKINAMSVNARLQGGVKNLKWLKYF
jgi:hypothetical protein